MGFEGAEREGCGEVVGGGERGVESSVVVAAAGSAGSASLGVSRAGVSTVVEGGCWAVAASSSVSISVSAVVWFSCGGSMVVETGS